MLSTLANDSSIIYDPPDEWRIYRGDPSVRSTTHAGFTANFTYTGTQIEVFGTVAPKEGQFHSPSLSFTIDGEHNFLRTLRRTRSWQHNIQFFQSPPTLNPNATHTLMIKSEREGGLVILNSLVVKNFTDPPQTPSSQSLSSPGSSTSASPSALASSSKLNVGGIVGGVIAVLVVLASLLAFLLYRRRRRIEAAAPRTTPFTVTPFVSTHFKPSSPNPEILNSIPKGPSFPFSSPPVSQIHHDPPAFVAGSSDLGRHSSMYKPRPPEESLPPMEYGYGVGMPRDEWTRYAAKPKS